MLGMYVSGNVVFASLATGSIIVVAVAVLGSLTVLPAMLVAFGRAIDRPRVPLLWRLTVAATPREPSRVVAGAASRRCGTRRGPSRSRPARWPCSRSRRWGCTSPRTARSRCRARSSEKQTLDRLTAAFPSKNTDRRRRRALVRRRSATRRAPRPARPRPPRRSTTGTSCPAARPALTVSRDGTTQDLQLDMPFDAESDERPGRASRSCVRRWCPTHCGTSTVPGSRSAARPRPTSTSTPSSGRPDAVGDRHGGAADGADDRLRVPLGDCSRSARPG